MIPRVHSKVLREDIEKSSKDAREATDRATRRLHETARKIDELAADEDAFPADVTPAPIALPIRK